MSLYLRIKTEIEQQTCSIHHQHPTFDKTDGKPNLVCCCADFKTICFKLMIELLNEYKQINMDEVNKLIARNKSDEQQEG